MLSSTLFPINTCLYFLFRAAICVCVFILPHLTQGPGCAESLIFPSSTLSPQPNTVLYQKVAKPRCLVVITGLTSFLPALPSSAWGLVLGGEGVGAERREESIQSRVYVTRLGADQHPQTSKGSGQKSLEGVGVCLLKEYAHLQFWNWKDEHDHENITQCLGAKVFVVLSNRAVSQGT